MTPTQSMRRCFPHPDRHFVALLTAWLVNYCLFCMSRFGLPRVVLNVYSNCLQIFPKACATRTQTVGLLTFCVMSAT